MEVTREAVSELAWIGNGGWIRIQSDDRKDSSTALPAGHVGFFRFVDRQDGDRASGSVGESGPVSLAIADAFIFRADGRPLIASEWRKVKLGLVERFGNSVAEEIRRRADFPGPLLRDAAECFDSSFGAGAVERGWWTALMINSQIQGSGVERPSASPRRGERDDEWALHAPDLDSLDLTLPVPHDARSPEFLLRVAERYTLLTSHGATNPNRRIQDANQVENKSTVDRWVRLARDLGYLPKARHGKAG